MASLVTGIHGPNGIARAHAFRLLLQTGRPVAVDDLARSMHADPGEVAATLEELDRVGRIRRDQAGRVIGSAGLSVVPDRHEMTIGERTLWTWCAYDILGIMGALKASGTAASRSPDNAAPIEVRFHDGVPQSSGAVLFRPDDSFAACCSNVYMEWCPNSNFFETAADAEAWSRQHGVTGAVFTLGTAAVIATSEWAPLLDTDQ